MSKFNDPIGAEPITYTPKKPSAVQIAAIGAALPPGKHVLTHEQQMAWFGGVVFGEPVEWSGRVFICGDTRLTPRQVVRRVSEGI